MKAVLLMMITVQLFFFLSCYSRLKNINNHIEFNSSLKQKNTIINYYSNKKLVNIVECLVIFNSIMIIVMLFSY